MTGKQLDQERYEERIDKLIEKNSVYADALEGFRYWSDDQSYRTVYYYLVYIVGFLNATNKSLDTLRLDDWTRYAAQQKKFTSGNQISKYSAVKRFAEYLVVSERNERNFMSGAKRPKYIETQEQIEKREEGFLTPTEIKKVIQDIEYGIGNNRMLWFQEEYRSRDMAIVLLLLSTGIRASALINLNVEDVDFEEATITVTDKGDKVNKHNLPETTMIILKKWLIKREELLQKANITDEHALFISKWKKRFSYNGLNKLVCKYCSTAVGRKITPHKLRATYGTILYNKTHDIEFVRQQMNHSSVITTQRYIRGNGKENRKKAADIMGGVISRSAYAQDDLFADTDNVETKPTFTDNDDDYTEPDPFLIEEF